MKEKNLGDSFKIVETSCMNYCFCFNFYIKMLYIHLITLLLLSLRLSIVIECSWVFDMMVISWITIHERYAQCCILIQMSNGTSG